MTCSGTSTRPSTPPNGPMPEAERQPIPGWTPPSRLERKRILDDAESIAIVGASPNPARASNFVATYLLSSSADYRVYMVNPRESEILGLPVYPSLEDLPEVPDIVDVFRRAEDLPPAAEAAAAIGARHQHVEQLTSPWGRRHGGYSPGAPWLSGAWS